MAANWTLPSMAPSVTDLTTHALSLEDMTHVEYANETGNGIRLDCSYLNGTGIKCTYTNPFNLTDFLLPRSECELEPKPMYLYCDGGWTNITESVYGYVSPCLVLFTIITNILMSVVLLKKNMRNPTNILLVAMALSDMFTGLLPVPCFLYFFTMGNYKDFVPYNWCFIYDVMTAYLPTIFHTASIWLTVALALQRYICVCHSLKAKRWCTIPNAIKVIIAIYIVAILTQITRFFELNYVSVTAQSLRDPSVHMETCYPKLSNFVTKFMGTYFQIYYWVRVIFIHLIPCTSLVVLNAMLIAAMRSAQARREQLLKQNRRSECRRLKESNCTTLMLVAVVGLFLLVELPLAIILIMWILSNTFDLVVMTDDNNSMATMVINLLILLSYPLNFFIYCGMSRHFRETFCRLFKRGAVAVDREASQYMSLATENGGGRHSVGCNTKSTVL